jgi:hypothetical protein
LNAFGKLRNDDDARSVYRSGFVADESPMTWDWAVDWVTIRQEDGTA